MTRLSHNLVKTLGNLVGIEQVRNETAINLSIITKDEPQYFISLQNFTVL